MRKLRMLITKVNQCISGVLACMIGCYIYLKVAKETDKMMVSVINPSASSKEAKQDE